MITSAENANQNVTIRARRSVPQNSFLWALVQAWVRTLTLMPSVSSSILGDHPSARSLRSLHVSTIVGQPYRPVPTNNRLATILLLVPPPAALAWISLTEFLVGRVRQVLHSGDEPIPADCWDSRRIRQSIHDPDRVCWS